MTLLLKHDSLKLERAPLMPSDAKKIAKILLVHELPRELKEPELRILQTVRVISPPILTPEEIVRIQEARRKIEEVLNTLDPREAQIVRRVIMNGEKPKEVGEDLNITGSWVGQIKVRALRKLRCPRRARILRDCLAEIS